MFARAEGGAERWLRAGGKVFFTGDSPKRVAKRLILTLQDISELKGWEVHQKLLLRELSHRVKNTLTVVLSMARQSFKGNGPNKQFFDDFEGRLAAIAGAHNLLFESEWKGADLTTLARTQLAPYFLPDRERVDMGGPAVVLSAQLATAFALLIHELGTNAVKHGSLSRPDGRVTWLWSLKARDGEQLLELIWREHGGPAVEKPHRFGLGSYLIEQGVPEAKVVREFRPDGLVCRLEVPISSAAVTAKAGTTQGE